MVASLDAVGAAGGCCAGSGGEGAVDAVVSEGSAAVAGAPEIGPDIADTRVSGLGLLRRK